MAETSWLIDPTNGTSIFRNTSPVEKFVDIWRNQVCVSLRIDASSGKAYLIATRTQDDARYPPREFESLEAAHVFLRLTEGEP